MNVNVAVIGEVPLQVTVTPDDTAVQVVPVGVISVGNVNTSLSVESSGMGDYKVIV